MEQQLIPVVSKQLKVLNTINQVVKKSFLRYFVVRNGVIFTDDNGLAMEMGLHFSYTNQIDDLLKLFSIPEGYALMLNSQDVFVTIRDNKKIIKYLKFNDNGIFISGDMIDFPIGRYVKMTDAFKDTYRVIVDRITKKSEKLLTDEDIQKLINNEILTFGEGDKRVRLTKALFPHIKVGLPMSVTILDIDDPNLFETMISITKDDVTNFHVYTCIKF